MGAEIDSIAALVFGLDQPKSLRLSTGDLQSILRRIGGTQFIMNKVHESLVTQLRAASFLSIANPDTENAQAVKPDKVMRETLKLSLIHI